MLTLTERDVEVPWAVANAVAPTLDVGCAESTYLAQLEGPIDGIDIRPGRRLPLRRFYHGDIRQHAYPDTYQTVLAISTIEHIGLAHKPYGTEADNPRYGDRDAVINCMLSVRPGGRMLMSVPYGRDEHCGWYRVYDDSTLAALLNGYDWTAEYHLNSAWTVGGVALVTVAA